MVYTYMTSAISRHDSMLNKVTQIIDVIGTDEFCVALSQYCKETLSANEVTLFYFPANEEPLCLFSDVAVPEAVRDYIGGYYLKDKELAHLSSLLTDDNVFTVESLHMDQIDDSSYKKQFYKRTGVEKKISLVSKIDNGFVYGNFYRHHGEPDFEESEIVDFKSTWEFCLSCLKQHVRISSISCSNSSDRSSKLVVIEKILHVEGLTPRESDVTARIVLGYSTTAIALDLNIAENTVSTLRRRAYAKLSICSQNELFEICFRRMNDIVRGKSGELYDAFMQEGAIVF